jgi:hypothetical protein
MSDLSRLMLDARQPGEGVSDLGVDSVEASWPSWDEGALSFDAERFKELVHHICWICEDPRVLNVSKLNWILWYAECNSCLSTKRHLTGAIYTKRPDGPFAIPAYGALKELIKENMIVQREEASHTENGVYYAVRQPNLDRLNARQIAHVEAVVRSLCFGADTTIPNRAALDRIFRLVRLGEHIPYFTVFAGVDGALTNDDIDWGARRVIGVAADGMDPGEAANPFVRLAYRAALWRVRREPDVGVSLPIRDSSFFVYRQAGRSFGLPDITIVYTLRLDQLVVRGARLVEDE